MPQAYDFYEPETDGMLNEFVPVGDWYVDDSGQIVWFSEEEIF